MATAQTPTERKVAVKEMSWDPITRIVGSLGIHTEIDFDAQKVEKCYSTSMIFRGFDIFMKGIDPRDSHFITSRICGICGDNHCTTSCVNQNMAYGVKPPALGDLGYNLAETRRLHVRPRDLQRLHGERRLLRADGQGDQPVAAAEGGADAAPRTPTSTATRRSPTSCGRSTRSPATSTWRRFRWRATRARCTACSAAGTPTPRRSCPAGSRVDITHQTCTDYYVRLMRYIDYVKRSVPMHDDLYDFFLQELPGYDMVGYRDTDLICWGYFDDPDYVDYNYRNMTDWGRKRYITPGVVFKGELVSTDLVEINGMMRILLGSSYFDDWTDEETFVTQDPLGNPVDKRHPVEQGDPAEAAEARLRGQVQLGRVAADVRRAQRHLRRQRHRRRPVRPPVGDGEGRPGRLRLREGDRAEHADGAAADRQPARDGAGVEDPGEVERDRARPRPHLPRGLLGADRAAQPGAGADGGREGRTKSWNDFKVPQDAISVGFCEAARGVLSHHMVIRDGKVANYQPYPPTPWNSNPRDTYGTPGPYEDAVQNTPIFEENGPENFKGVDIMRAVRSFDPCLPCGVHMYTGKGRVRKVMHTPTGMS